jgi:hypothetical protein
LWLVVGKAVNALINGAKRKESLIKFSMNGAKHAVESRAISYECSASECVAASQIDALFASRRQFAMLDEILALVHDHG